MYITDIETVTKRKHELEILVQNIRINCQYTEMEFTIGKYSILIKKAKIMKEQFWPIKNTSSHLEKKKYKYMGMLEGVINQTEMKEKVGRR